METSGFVVREACESSGVTFADAQRVTVSGRRPGNETDTRGKAKSGHEGHTGGETFASSKEHDETTGGKDSQHPEATDATNADQES